jgi:hypothetical protein
MNQGQPSSFFNDPTEDHPGPLPSSSFFNDPTEDHPGPLPPSPPDASPQLHPPSSPLRALHTDSGRVLAVLILVCLVSIGLFFHVSPLIGGMLFLVVLLTTLAIEWRSFTTLSGRINWPSILSRKRFWLIGASVFVFVVLLLLYLVRAVRGCYQFVQHQLPKHLRRCRQWGRAAARKGALIIGSGIGNVARVYHSSRASTRTLNYLRSQDVLTRLFAASQACALLLRSYARVLGTAAITTYKATSSQKHATQANQARAISTPLSMTTPISITIPTQVRRQTFIWTPVQTITGDGINQTSVILSKQKEPKTAGESLLLSEGSDNEVPPDWLPDGQARSPDEHNHLPAEMLEVLVSNTVAVMTGMQERRDQWHKTIADTLKQAQSANHLQDAELLAAILAVLEGQSPRLPEHHPYARHLDSIQSAFVAGGAKGDSTLTTSKEVRQAVHDFVNAEDWDATRQVVEAQQTLLFRPEVEALFEWNIAQTTGEQWKVDILEQHLALLRNCKKIGIAEAFEKLAAAQQGTSDRLASADEHFP